MTLPHDNVLVMLAGPGNVVFAVGQSIQSVPLRWPTLLLSPTHSVVGEIRHHGGAIVNFSIKKSAPSSGRDLGRLGRVL